MALISVICNTIRPEGVEIVKKALDRQTFKDFELIIQGREAKKQQKCVWTFNHDMNTAIKKATGELVISWQDYTYAKPDTLEKFWQHYLDNPKAIVGAVGNKYTDDTFLVQTWQDPRERTDQGTFYECTFPDIEANLASYPRKVFYDLGGLDEDMDRFFGLDFYAFDERVEIYGGYKFYLDQTIKSYSLEHTRSPKWNELNWLKQDYNTKRVRYLENPILNYIK